MPEVGEILIDKATGSTYEFIETGMETRGERVTLKITMKEKGRLVPDHIHLLQNETFKILKGELTCIENGKEKTLKKGEHILLEKGIPHNHYNTSSNPVEYIQTIEPAFDIDFFIENYIKSLNSGRIKNREPSFLQKMATLKYLDSPTLLAGIPLPIQKVLVNLLGPLAKMFGYRALYQEYTGIEK